MTEVGQPPPGLDVSRPSPARMYDYYLGGINNFQVDRDAAAMITRVVPELRDIAWANRSFHQRSARWIAERDVRQFIDVGAGLPTAGNTHDVVQKTIPAARVAYLDNDPMVLAHASSLISLAGNTRFIAADVRDPDDVLHNPELRGLIDFDEPVGFLITAVLHVVTDDLDPWRLLARYLAALPSGSYLSLSHMTADKNPPRAVQAFLDVYATATQSGCFRTKEQVERFFDGLELVPPYEGAAPAICYAGEWGADDPALADSEGSRWLWCGVARRP
ncbi:MAG TPA: SAM-dependent methyltransferase [Streptosporangiaceae bacterium]|nr:SAM-dependent methyltransferase [Streptosporangiaceae bacterium]